MAVSQTYVFDRSEILLEVSVVEGTMPFQISLAEGQNKTEILEKSATKHSYYRYIIRNSKLFGLNGTTSYRLTGRNAVSWYDIDWQIETDSGKNVRKVTICRHSL